MGRNQARSHINNALTPQKIQGNLAEQAALEFLTNKGFKLRHRNFSCLLGEIDLIMQEYDTLIFVEVRYRASKDYGSAHATVTPTKQRKVINTSRYYLQKTGQYDRVNCRFDVIAFDGNSIEWIPNAFQT